MATGIKIEREESRPWRPEEKERERGVEIFIASGSHVITHMTLKLVTPLSHVSLRRQELENSQLSQPSADLKGESDRGVAGRVNI